MKKITSKAQWKMNNILINNDLLNKKLAVLTGKLSPQIKAAPMNKDGKITPAVAGSLSAMITWLKVERNYSSKIKDQDEFGGYFEDTFRSDGDDYFMCYRVHDLIGETSHKTGKLVIKGS